MNAPEAAQPADRLLEQMRRLQDAFDSKIRYDEVRERLVESMHEELQAYRQNLQQMQLRPILLDLVSMHDDLTKSIESAGCSIETAKALTFFRDTVEQTLARNGVESFLVEGSAVDRSRQKVISVIETADPDLDRRVAQRLRPGFSWNGKVLRPEWVSAYLAISARPPDPAADGALDRPAHAEDHPADPDGAVQVAANADKGAPS
jgi:molecular chaperone GrpE (heat shock protein)